MTNETTRTRTPAPAPAVVGGDVEDAILRAWDSLKSTPVFNLFRGTAALQNSNLWKAFREGFLAALQAQPAPAPEQDAVERVARAICKAGITHEVVGDVPQGQLDQMVENLTIKYFPEARAALAAMQQQAPCEHCDGTGDVHRADGEWLGECADCAPKQQAGEPLKEAVRVYRQSQQQAPVADDVREMIERLEENDKELYLPLLGEAAALFKRLSTQPQADAAVAVEQWQPIETAPKGGTTIDVWRDGNRETVYWGFPPHDCGEMGQHCDSDWHGLKHPGWICSTFGEYVGGEHDPFTHWMPLPTGPAAIRAGGKPA